MALDNKRAKNNNSNNANRFSALSEDEIEVMDDSNVDQTDQEIIKLPPLKVISQKCETIHAICTTAKIEDYCVKKISIGVKVLCDSVESRQKLINWFQIKKLEFFTHPFKNERPFKAVLFGLEAEPADVVKNELLKRGLQCEEVKAIVKEHNYGHETIYIIIFKNGSTNIADLRKKVTNMFHTIVRWEHYKKPKGLLVQCRNCQIFGHGERNCHVKTKCGLCGKDHKTYECNIEDGDFDNYTCANCGLNHKADVLNCPQRLLYQEVLDKSRSRTRASKRQSTAPFIFNESHFPPMATPKTHQQSSRNLHTESDRTKSYAAATASRNQPYKDDLFSESEINALLLEMLPKLSACRSKVDKFRTISSLAIKYLYNNLK